MRRLSRAVALALLCLLAAPLLAQKRLTIEEIFSDVGLTGRMPEHLKWSPEGRKLTFILRDDSSNRGDLWAVDTANGEKQILVSHEQLASLRGKLLLVHGTADDNGHMQNSLQLAQEFIQAGEQFDLLLDPQKPHSLSGPVGRRHLFTAITEYFKKNLYRMRIR